MVGFPKIRSYSYEDQDSMIATHSDTVVVDRRSGCNASFLLLKKTNRNCCRIAFAKKNDLSENSTTQQPFFPLKVSNRFLAQSAIGVFALGFIDAGYSGDWSRIGVISKETEDLLKAAAFLVVPLCLFLVFSLSKESQD